LPLRDLLPDESQKCLTARGVPGDQHAAILAFTHGHPLALTLIAGVLNRDGAPHNTVSTRVHSGHAPLFEPEPDVVRALLERLVQDAPSPAHRLALDIRVRMWATTETLLADILAEQDDADATPWRASHLDRVG
jgi:hypothetical protein